MLLKREVRGICALSATWRLNLARIPALLRSFGSRENSRPSAPHRQLMAALLNRKNVRALPSLTISLLFASLRRKVTPLSRPHLTTARYTTCVYVTPRAGGRNAGRIRSMSAITIETYARARKTSGSRCGGRWDRNADGSTAKFTSKQRRNQVLIGKGWRGNQPLTIGILRWCEEKPLRGDVLGASE